MAPLPPVMVSPARELPKLIVTAPRPVRLLAVRITLGLLVVSAPSFMFSCTVPVRMDAS